MDLAPTPGLPYHYNAKIIRVVDGDTVDVELDLGFNTFTRQRLRMLGYDAPERKQPGFELATTYFRNCLTGTSLVVHTTKRDSFGRWLAWVYVDGDNVSALMDSFLKDLIIGF
jgi:micrococcal nuclease